MPFLSLNHDVLSAIMAHLDQQTLLHLTRMCKTTHAIGTRVLVADVRVEVHRVSSFVAFMLTPDNHTRFPPLLHHLAVSEDHFDVALARLERNSPDPEKEQHMLYGIAARALAHLLRYAKHLRAIDIVCLETLLDLSDPLLADALAELPRLRYLHLYSPGVECDFLAANLKSGITHIIVEENPADERTLFTDSVALLRPFSETLTTLTLRDVDMASGAVIGQPVFTLPNVLSLQLARVGGHLNRILDMFPNVQILLLEGSEEFDMDLFKTPGIGDTLRHIEYISTDLIGLEFVDFLLQPGMLALAPGSDCGGENYLAETVSFFRSIDPYGLSIEWPLIRNEPRDITHLGRWLPKSLKCLNVTLIHNGRMNIVKGNRTLLEGFRTSSPLAYLHITLKSTSKAALLSDAPLVLTSIVEGTFVPPLAETIPSLHLVSLDWAEEGYDLMCWRVYKREGGKITAQRMKAFEGRMSKIASFTPAGDQNSAKYSDKSCAGTPDNVDQRGNGLGGIV